MNLREINRMIAALIAEDRSGNHDLIAFYRRKREELLEKIDEEIARRMDELEIELQEGK